MDIKKSRAKDAAALRSAQMAGLERCMKSLDQSFKAGTLVVVGSREKSIIPTGPRKLRVATPDKERVQFA